MSSQITTQLNKLLYSVFQWILFMKLQENMSVLLILCWWRIYADRYRTIIFTNPQMQIDFIPFHKQIFFQSNFFILLYIKYTIMLCLKETDPGVPTVFILFQILFFSYFMKRISRVISLIFSIACSGLF